MLKTPQYYNLPHSEFRPYQAEAIEWVNENRGNLILSAATGSGKTSIAKSLAKYGKTVALVATKSLQQENYGKTYQYDVLMGKNNYRCAFRNNDVSGEFCNFTENMASCPAIRYCEYANAKKIALASSVASVNYAYYLTTDTFKSRPNQHAIIMDEAHLLPSLTLNYIGLVLDMELREKYNLPEFLEFEFDNLDDNSKREYCRKMAIGYLHRVRMRLDRIDDNGQLKLDLEIDEDEDSERNKLGKLKQSVKRTLHAIQDENQYWFIKSGNFVLFKDGTYHPGFEAHPLTAKYHFSELFLLARTNLLMSATIGNPEVFAKELGIKHFKFNAVPSQFTPEERVIYDLSAPKMCYTSSEKDYEEQARIIAQAILSVNKAWSGIIHVNSKNEAARLAKRLQKHGLAGRLFVPPENAGTSRVMQLWNEKKEKRKNAIIISWSLHEGVDLLDEKICISAKVPFKSLGSSYEKMRMQFSPKFYKLEAAWGFVQSLGRTRRGRPEDYGKDNGLVAIADGNWHSVKNYIDADILKSIVKY